MDESVVFWTQVLVGFLGSFGLAIVMSPLWLFWLANHPVFARVSPFTTLRNGEAKIIVRGDSFRRVIARQEGYELVTPKNNHLYPRNDLWDLVKSDQLPKEPFLQRWFGLYWVGIPPFQRLYHYTFDWVSYKTPQGETEPEPVKKREELCHIYVKDTLYWGILRRAESYDKLPLDVEFLLTLKVVNAQKALFSVHKYLDTIMDLVRQRGRQYIVTRSYDQLVQEEGVSGTEDPKFFRAVSGLGARVLNEYGVCIVTANIISVELAGTAAGEYQRASTATFLAEAEKTGKVKRAEGEAEAIKLIGHARQEALKAQAEVVTKSPEAARAILSAEAARAMGIEHIARAITAGIRTGLVYPTPPQEPQPPADAGERE